MLTVACVQVGSKYSQDYVLRLKKMIDRYLIPEYQFICLTDRRQYDEEINYIDVSDYHLPGWWAKMCLFNREIMPKGRILYFDLDTLIIGNLTALAMWGGEFGICANFTRAAGHKNWPCNYGSCIMSLAPGFGQAVWNKFYFDRTIIMKHCPHGDQQAIEKLHPTAEYLQPALPDQFFIGYRDITNTKPEHTSVVVFAGNQKPHNSKIPWVQKAWA